MNPGLGGVPMIGVHGHDISLVDLGGFEPPTFRMGIVRHLSYVMWMGLTLFLDRFSYWRITHTAHALVTPD